MSDASERTQFKFGNQSWKARSSHGRKPLFATPVALQDACDQYFQWVEDNPLMSMELAKFQGEAGKIEVPRMRAMTIVGLCNFIDMSRQAWSEYKAKPDFSDTCERAESIIYQQKVEGAAAELLNPNFIGREIGLVDKSEVTRKGEAITHIESDYVDP